MKTLCKWFNDRSLPCVVLCIYCYPTLPPSSDDAQLGYTGVKARTEVCFLHHTPSYHYTRMSEQRTERTISSM